MRSGKRLHQGFGQHAQLNADDGEEQAAGTQAECHREAHQQEADQAREHDRGHIVGNEFHSYVSSALRRFWRRCARLLLRPCG